MGIFAIKTTFKDITLPTEQYKNNLDYVLRKHFKTTYFEYPNCETKYMKWKNNKPVKMTQTQKNVKDAEIAAQQKEAQKETVINEKIVLMSRDAAIVQLKTDGVLNANGDLI